MRTSSLRARLTLVTLSLLVVMLAVVVTAITLAYRSSLEGDLRQHLLAAGNTVKRAGSADAAKALVRGLALEGIATNIETVPPTLPIGKRVHSTTAPVKPGTTITTAGALLEVHEALPDGTLVTFRASNASIAADVTSLLTVEIIVALAALLLATLFVWRGTRVALRPLSAVVRTAAQIAAGRTDMRLHPTRTDTELGSLAAAFDRMVEALERAVTQAQSAETAMRRFLADASHELRTPIAALQANAESLLREQPPRPRRDEIEAALARNASKLGRLVDDLLSLARLDGSDSPPREAVDIAELTRAAVAEARQQPAAPTILLDAGDATVQGDANGLGRVIRNLLDNACASVQPRGRIHVTAGRRGHAVEVRVADSGPGVPPADRERIFERFVRLDQDQSPGTGLGLAIARRIARQHDGDLTCDDTPTGASFTLRLPAAGC